MPHVIVKLWPGKSERQKVRLAEKIVEDVMTVLNYGEESAHGCRSSVRESDGDGAGRCVGERRASRLVIGQFRERRPVAVTERSKD